MHAKPFPYSAASVDTHKCWLKQNARLWELYLLVATTEDQRQEAKQGGVASAVASQNKEAGNVSVYEPTRCTPFSSRAGDQEIGGKHKGGSGKADKWNAFKHHLQLKAPAKWQSRSREWGKTHNQGNETLLYRLYICYRKQPEHCMQWGIEGVQYHILPKPGNTFEKQAPLTFSYSACTRDL